GKIWVTTYGAGLYVYRHGKNYGKAFSHITIKDGLTSSNYFSIAADDKKRLWLLSSKGFCAIDEEGKYLYGAVPHPAINFHNYATDVRYPKRIFYNTLKNELLVPVAGGLLIYYTDKKIQRVNSPIVFTGISIGGKPMLYDSLYIHQQTPEIPYGSNAVSFQFAALHYADPRNFVYEYKLHEDDVEWKQLFNSNSINFPALAAGHYTFMVRANDGEGHLSANTATFSFRIKPPFWQTAWFYLLIVAAVGFIVYGIYKYQLNKKLEVERLRLRISRDLHDDIGSALSSINILSKVALSKGSQDSAITSYLSKINHSSSQSMESMSDIVWAINPMNDKLEAIISRMKEFAADLCEAQGIELDFILPTELEQLSFDLAKRKNLFLVFKEAVNNSVKYSRCTQLKISFERLNNKIKMKVMDNGTGFDSTINNGGNGLRNMKERASECDGHLQVDSKLLQGTVITVEIPITRFGGK
ncbi:MAG: triple tyrosine motif-containing protein, partial [Ferruginibacter sp.]